MIILFVLAFGGGLIMLFTGFARSAAVNSGALDHSYDTKAVRQLRRARLRRHWLITLGLFALAVYAGLNLY